MIPEPRLDTLYQEVILDHNRRPRNYKQLLGATQYSHGVNPVCGDDYHLYLRVDEAGVIQDIGFQGVGCAISKSSASVMTTLIKEKNIKQAEQLKDDFMELMVKDPVAAEVMTRVGRLKMFEGVKAFPIRVKCATLIWHALQDALKDAQSQSKT